MAVSPAAAALESQPLGWLRSAPAPARRALFAASVGWMFDGFDIMIYSMVLTAVLAEFGISKTIGGVLGSLTLLASARWRSATALAPHSLPRLSRCCSAR